MQKLKCYVVTALLILGSLMVPWEISAQQRILPTKFKPKPKIKPYFGAYFYRDIGYLDDAYLQELIAKDAIDYSTDDVNYFSSEKLQNFTLMTGVPFVIKGVFIEGSYDRITDGVIRGQTHGIVGGTTNQATYIYDAVHKISILGLGFKADLAGDKKYKFYGKAGIAVWRVEEEVNTLEEIASGGVYMRTKDSTTSVESKTGFSYGVGGEYFFNPALSLRIEYKRLNIDSRIIQEDDGGLDFGLVYYR